MAETLFDRCEALRDLTAAERHSIVSLGREVSFAAGERIIEEGAAGTCFFVIVEGKVEVLKRGRPVAELGPGAILGEMALFNQDLRTSEARCRERCSLLSIPTAEFAQLVLQQDPVAVKVMS